jgi:hypothetical protein
MYDTVPSSSCEVPAQKEQAGFTTIALPLHSSVENMNLKL